LKYLNSLKWENTIRRSYTNTKKVQKEAVGDLSLPVNHLHHPAAVAVLMTIRINQW
jgi:hypothetical protein